MANVQVGPSDVSSRCLRCIQLLIVGAMFVALAASATAPSTHKVQTTTVVDTAFEPTWEALIDVFADHQWAIQTIDKSSGIISTDWMRVDEKFADCGGPGLAIVGATLVRFNVRAKGSGTGTSLAVNASFRQSRTVDGRSFFVDCTSLGTVENIIQNEVYVVGGNVASKRKQEANKAAATTTYFCTAAPADEKVALCARSEAGCATRQQEIIAIAGDATACASTTSVVCFQGKNADGTQIESCHPSTAACEARHTKSDLLEATACK